MTSKRFNLPAALAFDSDDDLWVTDNLNNRVLEFKGNAIPEFGALSVVVLAASVSVLVILSARAGFQKN